MFSAWTVGIRMIATSNFGLVASNIARQSALAEKSIGGLDKKMGGLTATGEIASKALTGVGLASAAAFAIGIKGAADFQTATIQTAMALGRQGKTLEKTMSNMKDFRAVALSMSDMSGQSIIDSMGLLGVMAGPGGITASKLLHGGKFEGSLAKSITQYADVQRFGKDKVPFESSVKTATTLAHDLQWFTPEQMQHGLDSLNRASIVSTHGVQMLATQIRTFAPAARKAQMTPDDTVLLGTWLDRMGLGTGRGGTGVNMFLKNLVAPRGKVKAANMYNLGIYDDVKATKSPFINPHTGAQNVIGAIEYLAKLDTQTRHGGAMIHGRKVEGQAFDQFFARAFDTNAANVSGTLGTHGGLAQLARLRAQMKGLPGLQDQQTTLMQGLNEETMRLTSSFKSLLTVLEGQNAVRLAGMMKSAADMVGGLAKQASDHPKIADAVGIGLGVAGLAGLAAMMRSGGAFMAAIIRLGKNPGVNAVIVETTRHRAPGVIGKVAGSALRIPGGLLSILGLPMLRSVFIQFGGIFRMFGMEALTTKGGLGLLGEVFAKLGLRAIPLVGEVLLIADALNFMFHHTKDIGKGMVIAIRWIMDTGGPLLATALIDCIKGLLNAINPVNWINAGRGIFDGIREGIDEAKAKQVTMGNAPVGLHLPKPQLGGGPIVQGSRMVVPSLHLPAPHAPGPRRERTREVAHHAPLVIHFNITAPHGNQADVERALRNQHRALADAVAEAHAKTLRTSGRAAGQAPAMAGASGFEFAGAPG